MEIIHISDDKEMRILKPKKIENNINHRQINSIKKCLFGIPDVEDVENLLQEQIREDWERIHNKFGICMEDIENMENARYKASTPSKKRKLENKERKISNSRKRRLFKPYNDRKITDFFQARKNAQSEKKEN